MPVDEDQREWLGDYPYLARGDSLFNLNKSWETSDALLLVFLKSQIYVDTKSWKSGHLCTFICYTTPKQIVIKNQNHSTEFSIEIKWLDEWLNSFVN